MKALLAAIAIFASPGFAFAEDAYAPAHECQQETTTCARVYGACVLFDGPRIAVPRLEAAFRAAAQHWGTKPDALAGWTVIYHGYKPVEGTWGATTPGDRRVDVVLQRPSCPDLVLVHEWGHASAEREADKWRVHAPFKPDDPRFEDSAILATLAAAGVPGCSP